MSEENNNEILLEGILQEGYGIIPKIFMKLKLNDILNVIYENEKEKEIKSEKNNIKGQGKNLKLIMCYLLTFGKNECFPKIGTIVEDLEISEPVVIESLKLLELLGCIEKKKLFKHKQVRNNKYIIKIFKDNFITNLKNLSLNLKKFKHINNTKDNNTNLFSKENNSSLRKQIVDFNRKKKVKFKYSLEEIKSIFSYINLWNNTLNTLSNKHKLDKMSKTLENLYEKINALKDGTFLKKYYICKKEIQDNKYDINELKKGLSEERIKEGIKNSLLQFESGYYPYTEKDKKRILSKSLDQTIYNEKHNTKLNSSFLKCLYNKPIKKDEKLENEIILNKDEEYAFNILTELNCFDEKYISQLSVDLYKKYYIIMYKKIDGVIAKDILVYKIESFEYFCNLFKEYVEKKKQDNEELETDKKFDFKMFRSLINQNGDDSHLWKDFINYLDKVYGINFKVSEMDIILYKETMKELAKENSKNT